HGVAVEIGESDEPIPIHFAFKHDIDLETADLRQKASSADKPQRDLFDVPSLAAIDDSVVNCTWQSDRGIAPLALFSGARIDYSLHRLLHYTGTRPVAFQNFVIFPNYQFYINAYLHMCPALAPRNYRGATALAD